MADSHAKNHDYHLVDPSPWPVIGATAAFIMAVGAIRWMHGANPAVAIIGLVGVLYAMFMWWREIIKEGDRERIQEFKGTVIRMRKGGNNANFTVRRTASNGILR